MLVSGRMANPAKEKRNKEMYEKRKKGATFGDLAKEYGVKRPTVFKICKMMEIKEKSRA